MARTIAIWVTGLLASAIVGAGIGSITAGIGSRFHSDADTGALVGTIAGAAGFACLRLWLRERVK